MQSRISKPAPPFCRTVEIGGPGGGHGPLRFCKISTIGGGGQIMPTKILLPPLFFRSSAVPKSARYTNGFFATTYNTQNDHLNPQGLGFENTLQQSPFFLLWQKLKRQYFEIFRTLTFTLKIFGTI